MYINLMNITNDKLDITNNKIDKKNISNVINILNDSYNITNGIYNFFDNLLYFNTLFGNKIIFLHTHNKKYIGMLIYQLYKFNNFNIISCYYIC